MVSKADRLEAVADVRFNAEIEAAEVDPLVNLQRVVSNE